MKAKYPGYVARLSTAKSPQQMFGSVAKSYFAEKIGVPREKIFCVSVMPCVAKKYESSVKALSENGVQDVDVALTTREAARLIRTLGIDPLKLAEENFDSPLGTATGAGVIFGATGGVMEAVLRYAAEKVGGIKDAVDFESVRGEDGIRVAEVELTGKKFKMAVVHGLANAKKVCDSVKAGTCDYDLIEVMACPMGCVGGAGQPVSEGRGKKQARTKGLFAADKACDKRKSQENTAVYDCYAKYVGGEPASHQAHEMLHTTYAPREKLTGMEHRLVPADK